MRKWFIPMLVISALFSGAAVAGGNIVIFRPLKEVHQGADLSPIARLNHETTATALPVRSESHR